MDSKIKIEETLFLQLIAYHIGGDQSQREDIRRGLQQKWDAYQRRISYGIAMQNRSQGKDHP